MENSFIHSLGALLDSKHDYNKSKWAQYLMVTKSSITHWLNGSSIPTPDKLYRMISLFDYYIPQERASLEKFFEMAESPIEEVTDEPRKFKNFATVSDYILSHQYEALQEQSKKLPMAVRLEMLFLSSTLVQLLLEYFKGSKKGNNSGNTSKIATNINRYRSLHRNFESIFDGIQEPTEKRGRAKSADTRTLIGDKHRDNSLQPREGVYPFALTCDSKKTRISKFYEFSGLRNFRIEGELDIEKYRNTMFENKKMPLPDSNPEFLVSTIIELSKMHLCLFTIEDSTLSFPAMDTKSAAKSKKEPQNEPFNPEAINSMTGPVKLQFETFHQRIEAV